MDSSDFDLPYSKVLRRRYWVRGWIGSELSSLVLGMNDTLCRILNASEYARKQRASCLVAKDRIYAGRSTSRIAPASMNDKRDSGEQCYNGEFAQRGEIDDGVTGTVQASKGHR